MVLGVTQTSTRGGVDDQTPGPPLIRLNFSSNSCTPFITPSRLIFMQISYPNLGDTPALLTRTSILLLRNSAALSHICLQLSLSVTSSSQKRQLSSPYLSLNSLIVSCPAMTFLSAATSFPPASRTLLLNSLPKP